MEGWEDDTKKLKNTLPLYGNKDSMNLNSMILTNILGSPYFKEELIQFKTFHEVVDEIYYKVEHMEPWEKNSRKLAGQVGMCAGVRGVAAGGIVSSAFCLLYKMFTFKLTRKQLNVMLNHRDSPYIRGVGFLYVRYSQPPADFWSWFSPYLEDEEEISLKAGGGYTVTIGEMCRMMLSTLDWFGTLFPRLPVTVQKELIEKLKTIPPARANRDPPKEEVDDKNGHDQWGEAARHAREDRETRSPRRERKNRSRERHRSRSADRGRRTRSSSRDRRRSHSRDRKRSRSRSTDRRRNRSGSRDRRRSRSRDRRRRSYSGDRRDRKRSRERRERRDRSRSRERRRGRSRSRERRRSRSHSRDRRRR